MICEPMSEITGNYTRMREKKKVARNKTRLERQKRRRYQRIINTIQKRVSISKREMNFKK